MNLNIKTTNVSLAPETREYLERKLMMLEKVVDFNKDNVFAQVELGKTTQHHKQGDIFRAEINLRIGGNSFRAVREEADLYSAIDGMKDEIGREVKSGKQRRESLFRRGARRVKKLLRLGKNDDSSSEA